MKCLKVTTEDLAFSNEDWKGNLSASRVAGSAIAPSRCLSPSLLQ